MKERGVLVMSIGAAISAALIAISIAGCSSEDPETPCDQMAKKICEGACACGSKCEFASHGVGVGFKSASSCEVAVSSACTKDPPKTLDKCLVALDSAACMSEALRVPAECD
ncbi:MAG: hypothetical protein U0359_21110 [Byssovorax sp.]